MEERQRWTRGELDEGDRIKDAGMRMKGMPGCTRKCVAGRSMK
jgi:hypothetical protein